MGGFDEAILSLYAKGLTTGEIQAHLAEVYEAEVSRDLISKVTDAVVEELNAWRHRPLDRIYPVVFVDALVVKIRDGAVANRPVYVAVGVSVEGERDVLGLWVGTGGEGAKQWLTYMTELKNRGVQDILIICTDGLKGMNEAIEATWPAAIHQTCVSSIWCAERCGTPTARTGRIWPTASGRSIRHPLWTRPRTSWASSPTNGAKNTRQ